jgi:hypothetical protein
MEMVEPVNDHAGRIEGEKEMSDVSDDEVHEFRLAMVLVMVLAAIDNDGKNIDTISDAERNAYVESAVADLKRADDILSAPKAKEEGQ